MNIEEYKKELAEWKKNHIDFYNEYVHAIKSRKATLTTYMHVYVFAMNQIPWLYQRILNWAIAMISLKPILENMASTSY